MVYEVLTTPAPRITRDTARRLVEAHWGVSGEVNWTKDIQRIDIVINICVNELAVRMLIAY